MAVENNTGNDGTSDANASTTPAKKTRQPRKPKAVTEASVSADASSSEKPVKKTRAKRGSKALAVQVSKPTGRRVSKQDANRASVTETVSEPSQQSDEFADLLKLEEENKTLRKQLSEKLRAENADLRKRLGQN